MSAAISHPQTLPADPFLMGLPTLQRGLRAAGEGAWGPTETWETRQLVLRAPYEVPNVKSLHISVRLRPFLLLLILGRMVADALPQSH
jgi:hypothetical protein